MIRRLYPKPDYVEKQQLHNAINRELYCGAAFVRPSNFSPARWRAALNRFRNEHFDRL